MNRPGFFGGYTIWKDVAMTRRRRFSPEIRERAVRLVRDSLHTHDSEHAAILSIAAQIGCSKEALRRWLRASEELEDPCAVATRDDAERIRQLERENRELRRTNEILRLASAFFAQAELDRQLK
jgi:transposase